MLRTKVHIHIVGACCRASGLCMLSSKSGCRHLASRIQQNKIEVSDFTTFTLINSPLARAAGLNSLKQPMVQPLLKSVELATAKRVIHVIKS